MKPMEFKNILSQYTWAELIRYKSEIFSLRTPSGWFHAIRISIGTECEVK
jgi:hypothetical protein